MEKSNGPRIEPWETPYLRDRSSDVDTSTCTVCFLSVRTEARVSGDNSYTATFRRRWSWSNTPKALAKSTKRAQQNVLSFIPESHWSRKFVKKMGHNWLSLNPDWLRCSRIVWLKYARICLCVSQMASENWQDRNWPTVWIDVSSFQI